MALTGSPIRLPSELENERRLDALFALQYRKSPLPDNRCANALVFIDGNIRCDALSGYLSHENLELTRLEAGSEEQASFASPQFVATILLQEAAVGEEPSYRVHIFEPVSSSMSSCDSRLLDYFRALVTNLLTRLTARRMSVVKEAFGPVKWHMCVPCLMECANIVSFLRHADHHHSLRLPQSFNVPSNCQEMSFGPLLVLRREGELALCILRTLVSLELAITSDNSDFELEAMPCSEESQDSEATGPLLFNAAQIIEKQDQQAVVSALQSIINSGCERHPKHTQNCAQCSEALCQRLFRSLDASQHSGVGALPPSVVLPPSRAQNTKQLKCPLCNWTYKYRETLEQHFREKHNDLVAGEDLSVARKTCPYCRNNSPHPRLAKGEVYPCGFAAYHCHFCGYKTNTKGNLEIHKQSEKHLTNVQKHERRGFGNSPNGIIASEAILAANAMHQQQLQLQIQQQMQQIQQQQQIQQIQLPPVQPPVQQSVQPSANFRLSNFEMAASEFCDQASLLRCCVCGSFSAESMAEMMAHLHEARELPEDEFVTRCGDPQVSSSDGPSAVRRLHPPLLRRTPSSAACVRTAPT